MYTLIIMIVHDPTLQQEKHLAHSFQNETHLSSFINSAILSVLTFTAVPIHDS